MGLNDLLFARAPILFHYSPYSFLPAVDRKKIVDATVIHHIEALRGDASVDFFEVSIDGYAHVFVTKFLKWDSDYFGITTYKLLYVLYNHNSYTILKRAVEEYSAGYVRGKKAYFFCELPSEDIVLIQALGESCFKLVESRLTYYLHLPSFKHERYLVRKATQDDTENLKRVARMMRNDYDRFHAETIFSQERADEFLATYVEESIKGFADVCIVPDEPGFPPDAFVTANYLTDQWSAIGAKISKMVLSAVSGETCKGWYIKLISEMAFHLHENGADYAFMHPATTNRAVIHSYEKLGCKYGKCVHVLTNAQFV